MYRFHSRQTPQPQEIDKTDQKLREFNLELMDRFLIYNWKTTIATDLTESINLLEK